MTNIKWIKITTDIFNDEKMLMIENMPEADAVIVIWFKLLCLAGRDNNNGILVMNNRLAYTDEMLASIFRRPLNTVRLALAEFEKYGMIEIYNGVMTIPNWEKHQNIEGMDKIKEQTRVRVAKHREKQKQLLCNATSNATVTQCNAIEEEKEEEKEEDIDKDIIDNKLSCQQIIDLYHQICVSYPKIRVLSEARKKSIKARMKVYSIDDIKLCFEKAENSNFLKGSNDRNWSADFDWLMSDKNMAKVIDGNYDNIKSKKQGKKNAFNNFNGRSYNIGSLESQLLGCDKPIEHDNP